MIRLTRTQLLPIGVDIGLESVKLLQLEQTAEQTLRVVAAARALMPADSFEHPPEQRLAIASDLIRQLIRQNGFHGREIVVALPREMVHLKNLRLPMIPPAEIDAAVQFEARNVFGFDVDAAQVRHLYAGEVRQGADTRQEVIVLAAKHADVDTVVEVLNRSGCGIASLDFEPAAIYRTIERFIRRREDEQEVHVLVDIGVRQSQLVVGKGRDISFYKPIDIGARHLHEAVARKLQISPDEARALRRRLSDAAASEKSPGSPTRADPVRQAVLDATRSTTEELAREIALCMRYYSVTFRGHRPGRLRLLGGEAADPQLQATLTSSLPIPVECGRPMYSVNTGNMKKSDRRGNLGEWTVAFGLALKLTKASFGARDGKPREFVASPAAFNGTGSAEVVDIAEALRAPGGVPQRAGGKRELEGEAVHA